VHEGSQQAASSKQQAQNIATATKTEEIGDPSDPPLPACPLDEENAQSAAPSTQFASQQIALDLYQDLSDQTYHARQQAACKRQAS